MNVMFWSDHILIKWLFTSLALLFNLSLRGVSSGIEILFLSDFSKRSSSIISLAIWLDVLLEFRSLVPQLNIMWSKSKSRTVGFAWSGMHLTLAELNGRTLTRHLWFSFFWSWWQRSANYFIISTAFIIVIGFIIITITSIIVIIYFIVFFTLLTFKSNRIINFICSYNIPIVTFRVRKFVIRKNFTIFVFIAVFLIIIIIIIIFVIIIINSIINIINITLIIWIQIILRFPSFMPNFAISIISFVLTWMNTIVTFIIVIFIIVTIIVIITVTVNVVGIIIRNIIWLILWLEVPNYWNYY